ncbi:MAG: hypothetical protein Q8W51_14130 [Candidatus Palauibacterales bacterium]|nr:hypothetical protein [Candidatus Palauibacterales bacterium]MDP2530861.1 hypothetical protein [Candidatus Palauibacterales bacterium]MDP2584527.1 hypothetical protein [Candidatus Palauibacterales bacterium]
MRLSHPRARTAAVGFVALLPLGLFALPGGPPEPAPPGTVQVSIDYDSATGTLSVSPDPVTVHRRDRVEWGSAAGPWRVVMPSADMPLGPVAHGKGVGAQKGRHAGASVAANAKFGTYKYIVALYDGSEVQILDPDVIVGPGS